MLKEEWLRWICSKEKNGVEALVGEGTGELQSVHFQVSEDVCMEDPAETGLAQARKTIMISVNKEEVFVAVDLGLTFPPRRIMRKKQNSPVWSALRDNQVCKIRVSRWSYLALD